MNTRKPIAVLIFLMLAVMITACNSSGKSSKSANSQQTSINNATTNATEDSGNGAPKEWPESLMGNLPDIKGKITSIDKDSKLAPDTIVVFFSEMEKKDAVDYVNQLKKLGYANGISVNNNSNILFSGFNSKNAAVNFNYEVDNNTGSVTYSPKSETNASNSSK